MQRRLVLLTALAVAVTLLLVGGGAEAQRYSVPGDDGNYIAELYDYEEQPAPARPSPRSYSPALVAAQRQAPAAPKPTPVAILKQINRHNEDGSYTYGFEGADGSFKIETKQANGEVKGKYGFVDDSGKVRVVEYGADKYGFQPSGDGITVAPPTLVDETTSKEALEAQKYQEYQEYQQPIARPAPPTLARRPAPAVARQPSPAAYQYTPQYETSAQAHTQAIYPVQQAAKPAPIFSPVEQHQSGLLRYESEAPAAAYRTGPVQFGPAAGLEAQPQAQPRPRLQPQARSSGAGGPAGAHGLLDQLARDYALPQDSAPPLHDISFGYY